MLEYSTYSRDNRECNTYSRAKVQKTQRGWNTYSRDNRECNTYSRAKVQKTQRGWK